MNEKETEKTRWIKPKRLEIIDIFVRIDILDIFDIRDILAIPDDIDVLDICLIYWFNLIYLI